MKHRIVIRRKPVSFEYVSESPLYALCFSNQQPFADPRNDNQTTMFIAVGSYRPGQNRVEIIKMDNRNMKQDFVIREEFPASKVMWIPAGALGIETNSRDILATSSDILRLYDFSKDETCPDRHFRLNQTVLMRNE